MSGRGSVAGRRDTGMVRRGKGRGVREDSLWRDERERQREREEEKEKEEEKGIE